MINEERLIEDIKKFLIDKDYIEVITEIINEQPKESEWIPCSKAMPEEHEAKRTIFLNVNGTEKELKKIRTIFLKVESLKR